MHAQSLEDSLTASSDPDQHTPLVRREDARLSWSPVTDLIVDGKGDWPTSFQEWCTGRFSTSQGQPRAGPVKHNTDWPGLLQWLSRHSDLQTSDDVASQCDLHVQQV